MVSDWNIVNRVFRLGCPVFNDDSWIGKYSLKLLNNQNLVIVKCSNVILERTLEKDDLAPLPVTRVKNDVFLAYRFQRAILQQ